MEVVKKQDELGSKIDSTKRDIIDKLTLEKLDDNTNQEKSKAITDKTHKMSNPKSKTKNQIINNAPNQGVQINENHGTVVVPKPLARRFTSNEAKKILEGYPNDFPIEIWLKGTTNESSNFFEQGLRSFQELGYSNISTTTIGMYVDGKKIEKDFQHSIENGKLVVSIFPQQ